MRRVWSCAVVVAANNAATATQAIRVQSMSAIVEKAYGLAKSGRCRGLADIRAHLGAEGYSDVAAHLISPNLRRDLSRLCQLAQGKWVKAPSKRGPRNQ